jgi:antitoxin PrlF
MTTLTITAKGQVTLRKDLLKHLGVEPGEKIVIDKLPGGRITVTAARNSKPITEFIGLLAEKSRVPLTIEQMNEITAQGWSGKK